MNATRCALLLAGGKGLRMGADVPKQFLPVAGKPLLMHTLEAFRAADAAIELVLVLPVDHQAYWRSLCAHYRFDVPHRIADGGAVRFDSVRNGLALVEGDALVAVHDGVRPLVSPELIQRCFAAAAEHGAIVPVREPVESLRRLEGAESCAVDRSLYRAVQTPQTFRAELLRRAYAQPYRETFTDDASVVEAAGYRISLIEGEVQNIKVTTPLDLLVAEQWLLKH
jgi:2-C-methyl-D-erythritol 4-phosphate cytidylyltransferase